MYNEFSLNEFESLKARKLKLTLNHNNICHLLKKIKENEICKK